VGINAQAFAEIETALDRAHGPQHWRRHGDPLDELIGTVLSQHTSDINTARAFASLKSVFPEWGLVAAAPTDDVAEAIRGGGLANVKAPRIQRILDEVEERLGDFDLAIIEEWSLDDARAFLTSLPGVGPKTAACVLLFSMGLPAMPVDTHVHRIALRTGMIPERTNAERAHDILEERLGEDRDRVYALHMNLIAHGKRVCHARHPRCEACVIVTWCERNGV